MNESNPQDIPVWLIVLIPFAFLVVFATTWCLVMWILSRVSGWSRLARSYRSETEPSGKNWDSVQGRVGLVSYKGVLECTTNEEGIWLRPGMLFQFAHPRLFLPWADLHGARKSRVLWLEFVNVEAGRPKIGSLAIEAKVFEGSEGRRLLAE